MENIITGNKHLDAMVKKENLINYIGLDRPQLGKQTYEDIEHDFIFLLNEYRMNHIPSKYPDYSKWKKEELFKLFDIHQADYRAFVNGINTVLESYTDKTLSLQGQRDILENQIRLFSKKGYVDSTKEKIYETLEKQIKKRKKGDQEPRTKKEVYLDGVLEVMQAANVNIIKNNEYMALTSLFELYDEHTQYLEDFKQNKKDLIKSIKKSSTKKVMEKEKCFEFIYESLTNNCKVVINFITLINDMDCQEIHSICNNPNYNNSTSHQEIKNFCKKIQHKHNNSAFDTFSNYAYKLYIKGLQNMDTNNPLITDKLDTMTKNNYLELLEEIEEIIINTSDEHLTDEYLETIKKRAFKAVAWFVFYLLYGKNKFSAYAVHSILNEHSPISRKLYQKLFLKDRKTASDEDFEMRYNYIATFDNTIGYMEPYKYNSFYKAILNKLLQDLEAKKSKK